MFNSNGVIKSNLATGGGEMSMRYSLFFVLVFTIFISGSAHAAETKSYKATTVDECLQEKECVWHAFSNQLGLNDYSHWVVQGKSLNKWNTSIFISAIGNDAPKFLPDLYMSTVEPLNQVMPIQIKAAQNKDTQYLIVFSRDVQKSINEWAVKLQSLEIDQQRSKNKYNLNEGIKEGCYTTTFTEAGKKGITKGITFIDTSRKTARYCLSTHLFNMLGFWGYNDQQPFSYLSKNMNKKFELTQLDKFLIYLLYQPEFKDGQGSKEIKKVFDSIFDRSKNNFLKMSITEHGGIK